MARRTFRCLAAVQLAPGQYFFTAMDQTGKIWTDSVAIMGEGPDAYITGDTFLCPGTLGFANVQVTGGTEMRVRELEIE